VLPVQFRSVGETLAGARVDLAVSVADELPTGIARRELYSGGFVCLHDPRHARLGRAPDLARYLEHEHVIVSYNGDLRGLVEDALGIARRVRVSVPSFHSVAGVVDGSALVATVPAMIAAEIRRSRPHLRVTRPPIQLGSTPVELLYREASVDDEALGFVRDRIVALAGGRPQRATR
jgi:LysR family transcriptional activator of mexEF-oprN operon